MVDILTITGVEKLDRSRKPNSWTWGTYFDTTDGGETFVKYSTEKKELDLVDDAANASLGGSVTMPDGTTRNSCSCSAG